MYKTQIEQIKALAAADPNAVIFLSNSVLWWATSLQEVEEATKIGKRFLDVNVKLAIKNNANNSKERARIQSMKMQTDKLIASKDVHLCPVGTKVITKPLAEFLPNILEKSFTFGKHGIDAFFATHHQNSVKDGKFNNLPDWNSVNAYLDGVKSVHVKFAEIQPKKSLGTKIKHWLTGATCLILFILASCKKEPCYTYSVTTYQKYTATLNGVPNTWHTRDSSICHYYEDMHTEKIVSGNITYFTMFNNRR